MTITTAVDRIESLTRANRAERDPEVERELVQRRHEAFASLDGPPGRPTWPPPHSARPTGGGPPVIGPDELTPETVRDGIFGHGSLLVRGLVGRDATERLVAGIKAARAAQDAHYSGEGSAEEYFRLFKPGPGYTMGPRWVRQGGGVLTADSPPMLFELLEVLEQVGLRRIITAHFGERPALSALKCTLRRTSPDGNNGWHQDGAFMGRGIRSLNVWMALSTCGVDAPSLDIVPRRFEDTVETGTHGAYFDWTVGPGLVDQITDGAPSWRPLCEPGDVMLFDDLCLHRTGLDPGMTQHRYAIESWFFAPSSYPDGQVPLVW